MKHFIHTFFTETQTNNVDLRTKCPDVYDQGKLGSCTANDISFAYEFDQKQLTPNLTKEFGFVFEFPLEKLGMGPVECISDCTNHLE